MELIIQCIQLSIRTMIGTNYYDFSDAPFNPQIAVPVPIWKLNSRRCVNLYLRENVNKRAHWNSFYNGPFL